MLFPKFDLKDYEELINDNANDVLNYNVTFEKMEVYGWLMEIGGTVFLEN